MSCFWNSLIATINETDKKEKFNTLNLSLTPHNLVVILKQINQKTDNVLWNNQELSEKQKNENKEAIENYDEKTTNDGYYCSTFEPFLFLLVEYLNITIIHDYNKSIINYSHKKQNKYTIKLYSDLGHCWH